MKLRINTLIFIMFWDITAISFGDIYALHADSNEYEYEQWLICMGLWDTYEMVTKEI